MFLTLRRRVQFQALRGKVDPILRTRLRMAYQEVKWVPVECQHEPRRYEAIKTVYHIAEERGEWFEGLMLILERTLRTNKYLLWGTRKGRWGYKGQGVENFILESLSSKNMVKLAYGPIHEIRAHLERGEMWLFEKHAAVLYKKMLPLLPGTKVMPMKRHALKKKLHPIMKKTPAAPLVGIELNPGPVLPSELALFMYFIQSVPTPPLVGVEPNPGSTHGVGTCFYCQTYSNQLERDRTRSILVEHQFVWSCRKCNARKASNSITAFMNWNCSIQWLIDLDYRIEIHDDTLTKAYCVNIVPAAPVVCVEPNPGPRYKIEEAERLCTKLYRHYIRDDFIEEEYISDVIEALGDARCDECGEYEACKCDHCDAYLCKGCTTGPHEINTECAVCGVTEATLTTLYHCKYCGKGVYCEDKCMGEHSRVCVIRKDAKRKKRKLAAIQVEQDKRMKLECITAMICPFCGAHPVHHSGMCNFDCNGCGRNWKALPPAPRLVGIEPNPGPVIPGVIGCDYCIMAKQWSSWCRPHLICFCDGCFYPNGKCEKPDTPGMGPHPTSLCWNCQKNQNTCNCEEKRVCPLIDTSSVEPVCVFCKVRKVWNKCDSCPIGWCKECKLQCKCKPPAPRLVGIEPNPGPGNIALIKLGQEIYRLHITSDPLIKIECWDKETWSSKGSTYSLSNLDQFLNQFPWTPESNAEFNALYHHMRATY